MLLHQEAAFSGEWTRTLVRTVTLSGHTKTEELAAAAVAVRGSDGHSAGWDDLRRRSSYGAPGRDNSWRAIRRPDKRVREHVQRRIENEFSVMGTSMHILTRLPPTRRISTGNCSRRWRALARGAGS
jgi:hypothetical protein